ncbi:carbohydrate ABC transporter permease [Kitasatospora sp. NPDC050543]|uniref:carbohydrate ABC transporter permease n=1 Tax=Kitasatospora sp. NPDC050543 TaxID=3364054 RepID=UPI0037A7A953
MLTTPSTTTPPRARPAPAARARGRRQRRDHAPYLLLAPSVLMLIAVLGFPLGRVLVLSVQHWGVRQIFSPDGPAFAGLDNYATLLGDPEFWTVLVRTVVLTAAMAGLSMAAGTGIALLMRRVPPWCRRTVTFALVLAWAVPSFVSTEIFAWMTDYNAGIVNRALGMQAHNWYADPVQGLAVATAVVVWGAVPLIGVTVYAGLGQVPAELEEAARLDGAQARQVFRYVTLPVLRPLLALLATLSVIWDFQVFNQIWILRQGAPGPDYFTLGIYAYVKAYAGHDYGLASASAVLTVLLLLVVMVVYLRQIARIGDAP